MADPEVVTGDDLQQTIPEMLPVFPVRDQIIFPRMVFPLLVGREGTLRAVEAGMMQDRLLLLLAQKDSGKEEVNYEDLYKVGVVVKVVQVMKLPNGLVKVLVEGLARAQVVEPVEQEGYIAANLTPIFPSDKQDIRLEGAMRHAITLFKEYVPLNRALPDELLYAIEALKDAERISDFLAAQLTIPYQRKQKILEAISTYDQLLEIANQIAHEIEVLQVERSIESQVRERISVSQRTYFLQEQIRAIKRELGDEAEDDFGDVVAYQKKMEEAQLSDEAREKVEEELNKLKSMPMMSPEATVIRNYVDWVLAIPWKKHTRDRHNISEAAKILDADHYGLKKPKDRILEHLAVLSLVKRIRGPLLCLVGPPGVGKTSLGASIARALHRKFVRISLGGVRDEAEIRGHRRTYIGSLPGRIVQSMKKAGVVNPVFLLDEVDKMSVDFRGDPASALLEVLDPEQNRTFSDHYLEVEYDLSQVMFVCTANTREGIPLALQDRMEIIDLPGYLSEEKLRIAEGFLIPKQLKEHGLNAKKLRFTSDAIRRIIEEYTREAGVRELERIIARGIRRIARKYAEKRKIDKQEVIGAGRLKSLLGRSTHHKQELDLKPMVGCAVGLAWTSVGGEVLRIQVRTMPGKFKLTLTGRLGDVMKESAQASLSYIRSLAHELDIPQEMIDKREIHIHIPEGAVPKDGPSAGVTLATALLSALTGRQVRGDLAMTGEIGLQGEVMPVGGINEKVMAAQRSGVKVILLPERNRPDWEDLPKGVGKGLEVHFVSSIDDVWERAFV
ncbi:MAG TPA: endopeptidase La [Bacteroidetes bacterium]|nr:endopeptidase La [Bacteroidota bacterium]HEX03687.1 endopeptidase La [Bacteroidota bacterium]